MTSITRKFGFYTGFADQIPKEILNKYVGSSWLHKLGLYQHTFLINLNLNHKTSSSMSA